MAADGEQMAGESNDGESGRGGGAFALGAMLGAALGAVVGLLWAPRSGAETRAKLKEKGEETADTLKAKGDELADAAREKGETARAGLEAKLSGDDEEIGDDDYLNTASDWGSGP
jgi:gas vesicle protein